MPSFKYQILCTRSLDNLLVYKAANNGIRIDSINFVETEPLLSEKITGRITAFGDKKITAVFTSMNAVEAVTAQLKHKPDWQIFCVGGMTKETVFNFFGEKTVKGTAKNARTLAEKIILSGNIKDVVFFCGEQRLDELPETLKVNEINVEEVVVYRTTLISNFITTDYDGILFFSPSAVHSFFSDNTIATSVVLFSIGNTTTATIKSYCTNKVITSEWPGKENMVDKVLEYYKQ